jgi:hypothetical protein
MAGLISTRTPKPEWEAHAFWYPVPTMEFGLRACLKIHWDRIILMLIVSFGRLFEDEDDDEDDSIPVNFQTGF